MILKVAISIILWALQVQKLPHFILVAFCICEYLTMSSRILCNLPDSAAYMRSNSRAAGPITPERKEGIPLLQERESGKPDDL